ncbi:ABC transporter permease [Zavarzinia compransoris]|uniref:Spermidine/putrescine transport system permease protein PotC n=1 Tax=Zavarzinia compransoris TaxID=1264899 RepID=A0A317EA90_9PROT|nr:ABC transporter permease [Zavarzinia compransoris]PWR23204.1 spermidine/putrescine ABC transporter permease PotC [Zavarzinia compransoris]TDP46236.1 spermidine/putrescine transport system permease protein [Zavarzinia compransoris]
MAANPLRRFPGTGIAALAFFAFLYAPVIVLIALSFNSGRSSTLWEGFTFDWYGVVLDNPDILRAAKNSLIVGTFSTVISTVLATIAAIGLDRARFRGRNAVNSVIALPLVVPEIVTAVATLIFFLSIGLQLGLGTVILAHVIFCIPFAYLPIRARLEGMPVTYREAAADLYANEWQTFRRVTLPLLWPGVIAGAMLAFITSLDDFVITYFVAGPGASTLPIYIFASLRMGVTPEVNAISSLMLVVSIVFVSISAWIGRRSS